MKQVNNEEENKTAPEAELVASATTNNNEKAVAQSDEFLTDEPQYELPPKEPFETKEVSFATALRWLVYKNYKQQCLRQPLGMACKLLCPALCVAILGIARALWFTDLDPGYTDYYMTPTTPIHGDIEKWIDHAICADEAVANGTGIIDYVEAARYLAIIPPPDTNIHIDGLLSVMNQSWNYHFDDDTTKCVIEGQAKSSCFPQNDTEVDYEGAIAKSKWKCTEYSSYLPFKEGWLLRYFDSDAEFNEFVSTDSYGTHYFSPQPSGVVDDTKPIGTAISFEVNEDGTQWSYKIRGNVSDLLSVPDTEGETIDKFSRNGVSSLMFNGPSNYATEGFIELQVFIEKAISKYIGSLHGVSMDDIDSIERDYNVMPVDIPDRDTFWPTLMGLYMFFSVCQFVYPFSQVVSQLISEKKDKIKEGMKMMGVTVAVYWSSWYAWLFIEATIIALTCWVVAAIFNVYKYSNGFVIFLWLELFCTNFVCFGTLFSTFFDNPNIATLTSFIVFVVLMLGRLFAVNMSESAKNALCLIGPCCFSLSTASLEKYESALLGLQWDNIYDSYDNFKFNTALVMLLVDNIIYILLTLYLDRVWPSRYGQRLHPLFFVTKSFWCPNNATNDAEMQMARLSQELKRQHVESKYENLNSDKYDSDKAVIKLRGLKKHFGALFDCLASSSDVVRAVDGVSLDIFQGEVFCLLGHNGAGKTTTINLMTGLLEVTDGDAWIDGYSIKDQMSEIRKNLGVCPQHDVLFKRLTAREHLELFARLKGVPERCIQNEVQRTLINVGIMENASFLPDQMSGGQKRKLSLGIALIGDSKIVFLDEPTSGMDPQSRRVTWDMINREKEKRCIILTTHFMDEADILGDRIAVMSDGIVNCCGSSLFLKRQYGVGYTFTVSLDIDVVDSQAVKQKIDEIVLKNIAASECVSNAGAEITYRLPFEQTECFAKVFDTLDAKKQEFNIKTYGISVTTLEEVFLKIGQIEAGKTKTMEERSLDIDVESRSENINMEQADKNPFPQPTFQLEEASAVLIFFRHISAILYQRLKLSYRDIRSLCCQILFPAVFTLLGLWILNAVTTPAANEPLLMAVDQWYDANAYHMPISNANNMDSIQSSINNPFTLHYNAYVDTWENTMQSVSGSLQEFDFADTVAFDAALNESVSGAESLQNFLDVLLKEKTPSDGVLHYNAFYIPSSLSTKAVYPTIYSVINASALHSLPITFNALNNFILRHKLRNISIEPRIDCYSWPLPMSHTEKAFTGAMGGLTVALFLMMALSFLPIGAIYNIVNDKSMLTKHQQLVSGVSCTAYWTANYIADFIISLPTLVMIWLLVHAFDADTFLGEHQGAFVLILLLFSLSVMPFTYLLSFLFRSANVAQVAVGTSYIILSVILLLVSFIVMIAVDEATLSSDNKETLKDIYRIFPTFLMADSLFQLGILKLWSYGEVYDWDVTGKNLSYMAIEAVGYFAFVIVIEYALLYKTVISKWWNKDNAAVLESVQSIDDTDGDNDVIAEMERIKAVNIENNNADSDADKVIISGLHKIYKGVCSKNTVHAVRGVHLGVKRGEVFGYLGVNGAGKTTTLACLTGERAITFGDAYVNGVSISNQTQIRRFVGYCPQFDALFPLLTGREHLSFYGRIKGLTGRELTKQVNMLLSVLKLNKYANRRAGTYSGGNRRKLSVAVSMIGNPPIVFLDEPSTGMDPMARRSMWEFIRETMAGRCVILTTHSMEECEALCHRLCIMTEGQLRCLGTPQHLKSKFGAGYQLDLTLNDDDEEQKSQIEDNKMLVEQKLSEIFNLTLMEHSQSKLVYEVTIKSNGSSEDDTMSLAQIFRRLEEYKKSLPITSYALNQTTLEQIFIKMAKQSY